MSDRAETGEQTVRGFGKAAHLADRTFHLMAVKNFHINQVNPGALPIGGL